MNSFQWVKPTSAVMVGLFVCLSAFILQFCASNIPYPPHPDTNLLAISTPEIDTADPDPHEHDIKDSGEMIQVTVSCDPGQEWGTFLASQTDEPDRLTPPPKFD
jgi:hypothetical protein